MIYIKIAIEKGYALNDEGSIFNPFGHEIKGCIGNRGYKVFSFRHNGKIVKCLVHQVQAFIKFGDEIFKKGNLVRHLDGNKLNNSSENISIGTHSDNMMDIDKTIRIEKSYKATSKVRKYNKNNVRDFYSKNKSYSLTMKHFNISSKSTLHYILNS